jgi:DNA-binding transcriptional LysR family regulator
VELRHLRYFVAVAEELHFRHAAELVQVAQPALSKQIRQLEEEIGVTLFQRSHHKIQLTPAGKAFYEKAKTILEEAKKAVAGARMAEKGEAGTVRIGFVSAATINILPVVLRYIHTRAPLAEVELKELKPGDQVDCLYRGQLDIGFLHAKQPDAVLNAMTVEIERLIVALPEGLELARERIIDLKKLAGETAIMPASHTTSGYYEHVRAAYQLAGVVPEKAHHTQLLQGLLLVAAGLGVSIVPESFECIHIKGVVYRRLLVEPPPAELIAAWRYDNDSPLLSGLIEVLRLRKPALMA